MYYKECIFNVHGACITYVYTDIWTYYHRWNSKGYLYPIGNGTTFYASPSDVLVKCPVTWNEWFNDLL